MEAGATESQLEVLHQRAPIGLIPKHEREHAPEMVNAIVAPLEVGFEDDFRITLSPKRMSQFLQLAAQFAKVIDLAVKDDRVSRARIDPGKGSIRV